MELCSKVQSQTWLFWTMSGVPARSTVLPTMCAGQEPHRPVLPPSIVLFRIAAVPGVWIPVLFCTTELLAIVAPLPPYPYIPAMTPVPFRVKLLPVTTPLLTATPHRLLSLSTLSFTTTDAVIGPLPASTPMLLETSRICSTTRLSPPRMAV